MVTERVPFDVGRKEVISYSTTLLAATARQMNTERSFMGSVAVVAVVAVKNIVYSLQIKVYSYDTKRF